MSMMYWPLRPCPTEGCQNQIVASQKVCTACAMRTVGEREQALRDEEELMRSVEEGLRALDAYLANHARYADWLMRHPGRG